MSSEITRREALKRAAWILGGTLSAPTILGVLSGCAEERSVDWTPRTLTTEQIIMVAMIADTIIPATETPGAAAAHVDQFVDAMLTEHFEAADRERFLAGLARVDARAQREHGQSFGELTAAQQEAIVLELDRLAFIREPPADPAPGGAQASPRVREGDVATGPPAVGANPAEAATPPPDAGDVGPESFFRMMKELAVVGYYTSEVGATRELRVNPMVPYRDIPYTAGTPTWA
jgi:hypothetical protein